jgi:hypothetical protein
VNTEHWRDQRKFAHTVLAAGFNRQYYGYVSHEVKGFLYKLLNDPKDHFALTDRFCGRISARLGYGHPESAAAHCKNAGEFIPQISPSGSIIVRTTMNICLLQKLTFPRTCCHSLVASQNG